MNGRRNRAAAFLLALALLLGCTACGGQKNLFASMHLVKTEGTVQVADGAGKSVKLMSNLGLYSGYRVSTLTESYGWILLDAAKLAKLDERSGVEVRKSGKELELYVSSGGLFFNVTEPLADDETMNIRTSTMVVGIRGTCGWVEVEDEDLMCVYLLRGKVECSVLDDSGAVLTTETITAGQAAKMVRADGDASITVAEFDAEKAPAYVRKETEGALDAPPEQTAGNAPSSGPEVDAALAEYRTIVSRADSYDYGGGQDGTYCYALVQMQTQYDVPALLLKQIPQYTIFEASNIILLFQYDPGTGRTTQASGSQPESSRLSLSMAGDGNGLFSTTYTPSSNASSTTRITLSGSDINYETLWEGDNTNPDWTLTDIGHLSIDWYSVDDFDGLNGWTSLRQAHDVQDTLGFVTVADLLRPYTGEYTPYESGLSSMSMDIHGALTGSDIASSGAQPQDGGVISKWDGSIKLTFSTDEIAVIYPAGLIPAGYEGILSADTVNIRYFGPGGAPDVWYHK